MSAFSRLNAGSLDYAKHLRLANRFASLGMTVWFGCKLGGERMRPPLLELIRLQAAGFADDVF
jgi:hypothetical protein